MTTNTTPSFVASFCKHVLGARRPNFIGYTHNQGYSVDLIIHCLEVAVNLLWGQLYHSIKVTVCFLQGLCTHWPHLF